MYIKVKVVASSKKEELQKKSEDSFYVWVKEPAERNLANKRVCEIIAREFKVFSKSIRIVSGHHSPSKILSIPMFDRKG